MYSLAQQKASMKWRENNKEKWNELSRENMKTYYESHKEEKRIKNLNHYYLKKEMKLFRNILL
jgi:hypothetical protein